MLELLRRIMIPWLIPPGVIGIFILAKYRTNDFSKLAAFFTLKPLVATPLWLFALQRVIETSDRIGYGFNPAYLITAGPGLGITLLVPILFPKVVSDPRHQGITALFILDTIRWGNSVLISVLLFSQPYGYGMFSHLIIVFIGLALPTIFALVALGFCSVNRVD